jgi:hypothetical protein
MCQLHTVLLRLRCSLTWIDRVSSGHEDAPQGDPLAHSLWQSSQHHAQKLAKPSLHPTERLSQQQHASQSGCTSGEAVLFLRKFWLTCSKTSPASGLKSSGFSCNLGWGTSALQKDSRCGRGQLGLYLVDSHHRRLEHDLRRTHPLYPHPYLEVLPPSASGPVAWQPHRYWADLHKERSSFETSKAFVP